MIRIFILALVVAGVGVFGTAQAADESTLPQSTETVHDETKPGADDPKYLEGVAAFERKDFEEAYSIWIDLAEAGNAAAQFRMGVGYHTGEYLEKDWKEAIRWYELAGDQGYIRADFNRALILRIGSPSVQRNYESAAVAYLRAAENHLPEAQLNLGFFYLNGKGVQQDTVTGFMWLSLASENGLTNAIEAMQDLDKHFTPVIKVRTEERLREWHLSHPRAE